MVIKKELLNSLKATQEKYKKGEYIFRESEKPLFYYYIIEGKVKLTNTSDSDTEFIHNLLCADSSFGESMLILERPYPVNAVAATNCKILKISRADLLKLMNKHPQFALEIFVALSENAYNKYVTVHKILNYSATERIIELMSSMKKSSDKKEKFSFKIPYTRKQLASFTSLRTETVIRAIKKMEQDNIVIIKNRKIFF